MSLVILNLVFLMGPDDYYDYNLHDVQLIMILTKNYHLQFSELRARELLQEDEEEDFLDEATVSSSI